MKTIEMSKAPAALSRCARTAIRNLEPLVITEDGKAVAALVPLDEDPENLALCLSPEFIAIIEESERRCPAGKGVSPQEMRAHLAARGSQRRMRKSA